MQTHESYNDDTAGITSEDLRALFVMSTIQEARQELDERLLAVEAQLIEWEKQRGP